MEKLYGFWN